MAFVTGFSGKFPSSDSLSEFWNNLCTGKDLVSTTERYPSDYHGLPGKQAEIKSISKFDSMFFGISANQASCLDPQIRMLLESVYESIVDAGYSMEDLAGSNTGVYVGGCFSDLHKAMLKDIRSISGYENTGCSHSMFSNRVSFCFNFRGPSVTMDTACSSSLVAFNSAVRDIQAGKITRAIVGGVSIVMDPGVSKSFCSYNMLSPTGKCQSFDAKANGYVRADAIGCVLLESESIAKCGYMRVLGTGVNSDGWKKEGITFPSSDCQIELCRDVCTEFNIDPSSVVYVEAHGTGTTVGDKQEVRAIDTVFGGDGITKSTLIGSIKSNMGHSEGASGIMALIKVLGILASNTIPQNLHFNPPTIHEPIVSGRLKVVASTVAFPNSEIVQRSRVAVNNFGFGGTNAHVLGEKGYSQQQVYTKANGKGATDDTARWIFGRTETCLQEYVARGDLHSAAWNKMMRSSTATDKFPFRGVVEHGLLVDVGQVPVEKPHIAFCYSGQGCQWEGMASDLFAENTLFRTTVLDACADLPLSLDFVKDLFTHGLKWMEKEWSGFGITLVQIGLTALLLDAKIVPDFIFGHSVGEVACGYADGCTSAREAAAIAFVRCSLSDKIESKGMMLAAGIGYDQAMEIVAPYPLTVVACNNSPDGVTISGPEVDVIAIKELLSSQKIFARIVPTDGIAYHSVFFKQNLDGITAALQEAITEPHCIARSAKWLSTSSGAKLTKYADATYHAENVAGLVDFAPVVASLPAGTIVLEVGPSSILRSMIKRCNPNVKSHVVMLKGLENNANVAVQKAMDACWLGGAVIHFPKYEYIVPMESRIRVQWDHEADWRVCDYRDFVSSKSTTITYDLSNKDSYMMDHVIDGRSLFPAMGHVYTAWQVCPATTTGSGGLAQTPFQLNDLKIHKAIILDGVSVSFTVILEGNHVRILHENEECACGDYGVAPTISSEKSVYMPCGPTVNSFMKDHSLISSVKSRSTSIDACKVNRVRSRTRSASAELVAVHEVDLEMPLVQGSEMYASLARYGYEYADEFQLVSHRTTPKSDASGFTYYILKPTNHWVAYMDNCLQASVCKSELTGLFLPTHIESITITTSNVSAVSNQVVCSMPAIDTIGNNNITIRGLHTTLSRKIYKPAVVTNVEFVPYGEHTYSYKEEYKQDMLHLLTNNFWKLYDHYCGGEYAFLDRVANVAPPRLSSNKTIVRPPPASYQACDAMNSEQFESVINFVYDEANTAESMKNVYYMISTAPGHDDLYAYDGSSSCYGVVQAHGLDVIAQILRTNISTSDMSNKYRLLELGAGSGGLTRHLYPLVERDVEAYIASDISNIKQFFTPIECVKYDLNEPWTGEKVNVIAASNAVHTGSSLGNVLDNIYNALVDDSTAQGGGYLLLHEYISVIPVLLWGLDDFAWSASDGSEREYALWITKERWFVLLKEHGFEPVIWYVDESETQMMLLARKVARPDTIPPADCPKHVSVGNIEEIKPTLQKDANTIVTLESADYGHMAFVKSLRKEPAYGASVQVKLVLHPDPTAKATGSNWGSSLPIAVSCDGQWGGYHEVPFTASTATSNVGGSAVFGTTTGMHAEVAIPGNLDSLHWVENDKSSNIRVSYCGLNFKDAMLAFGKLTSEGSVKLGLEFSGHRIEDNTRVMGISSGCMANTLYAHDGVVWDLPEDLSLSAASTIPVVYSTVYFALVIKAGIKAGDTVLIHSIAGGVGQAAYHICQHRGVNTIVTCSSSKHDWVHENLNIPYNHILDSHSVKFKDDVLLLTHGVGVDVVLNSLSGEKLIASIACLAPYGHFCEIGKYDIQQDSPVGLRAMERNISMHCIDLSDMFDKPKVWDPIHALVQQGLVTGEIKPLQVNCYNDVEVGLRCISAGKHIGKVIVDMEKACRPNEVTGTIACTPSFVTHGAHVVIGGLGGFGLEMVDFLWKHGAESVVVISRGQSKPWQEGKLASATVVNVNLIDAKACDEFIQKLANGEDGMPLVGVWHLGMVLNDCLFDNMTAESWASTVDVKAKMCRNLDESTRKYCIATPLEQFVMWSSVTALYGNPGQTNYGYANGVMEGVCRDRHRDGLVGTALVWGLIGGVGVMVNKGTNNEFAFAPQHIDSCMETIAFKLLHTSSAVVTSYTPSTISVTNDGSCTELTTGERVARILGVDISKIRKESDTLAALGMDSLQSVEIIGLLKKNGIIKTQSELQVMVWSMLESL